MDADKISSILRDTVAPVLKDAGYPMAAETVNIACNRITELEAEVKRCDEKVKKLAVTINSLYAEARKMLERDALIKTELYALQAHDKEAMELLLAALKDLMAAADDNGGCYGCISPDERCPSEQDSEICDCKTNNMWRWRHASRYEALKAQFTETT